MPKGYRPVLLLTSGRFSSASGTGDAITGAQVATSSEVERPAVPVYLALVDVCCGDDTLELMRSALQAALEALPLAARFGLITYSQRVRCGAGWRRADWCRTRLLYMVPVQCARA